jgi:hypothetical protein
MRAASSADRPFDAPASIRVAMAAIGCLPLAHVLAALAPLAAWLAGRGPAWLPVLSVVILYLAPPIAVRLALLVWPLREGVIDLESPAFLRWWFTAQSQMLFARMPWLEEALRLIPGLYSAWLRLWGSRVGALVYWAPRVMVFDRSLLDIGDRVAFGAGALLVPHVVAPPPGSSANARSVGVALILGRVIVGNDAVIGAYSRLLPGASVAAGEVTPPFRSIHAFSRWERGARQRPRHDA